MTKRANIFSAWVLIQALILGTPAMAVENLREMQDGESTRAVQPLLRAIQSRPDPVAGLEEPLPGFGEDPLDAIAVAKPIDVVLSGFDRTITIDGRQPVSERTRALQRELLRRGVELGIVSARDRENIVRRGHTDEVTENLPPEQVRRLTLHDLSGIRNEAIQKRIQEQGLQQYLQPERLLQAAEKATGEKRSPHSVLGAEWGRPRHQVYFVGTLAVMIPDGDSPPGTLAMYSYLPAISKGWKTVAEADAARLDLRARLLATGQFPGSKVQLKLGGNDTVNVQVAEKEELLRAGYLDNPAYAGKRIAWVQSESRVDFSGHSIFQIDHPALVQVVVESGRTEPNLPDRVIRSVRQQDEAYNRILEIEIAKRRAIERLGSWEAVEARFPRDSKTGRPILSTALPILFDLADPLDDLVLRGPHDVLFSGFNETVTDSDQEPVGMRTVALQRGALRLGMEIAYVSSQDAVILEQRGRVRAVRDGLLHPEADRLVLLERNGVGLSAIQQRVQEGNLQQYLQADRLLEAAHRMTRIPTDRAERLDSGQRWGHPRHHLYFFGPLAVFVPAVESPPGTLAIYSYKPAVDRGLLTNAEAALRIRDLQVALLETGLFPSEQVHLLPIELDTINVEVYNRSDVLNAAYLNPSDNRRVLFLQGDSRAGFMGHSAFLIQDQRLSQVAADPERLDPRLPDPVIRSTRRMSAAYNRALEIEIAKHRATRRLGSWEAVLRRIEDRPAGRSPAETLFLLADPLDDLVLEEPIDVAASDFDGTMTTGSKAPATVERALRVRQFIKLGGEWNILTTRGKEAITDRGHTALITENLPDEVVGRFAVLERSGAFTPEVQEHIRQENLGQYLNPDSLLSAARQATGVNYEQVIDGNPWDNPHHSVYIFREPGIGGVMGLYIPKSGSPAGAMAMFSYWPARYWPGHPAEETMDVPMASRRRQELLAKLLATDAFQGTRAELNLGGVDTINVEVAPKSELLKRRLLNDGNPRYAGKRIAFLDDEARAGFSGFTGHVIEHPRLTRVAVDRTRIDDNLPEGVLRPYRQQGEAVDRFLDIEIAKRRAIRLLGSWPTVAERVQARQVGVTPYESLAEIAEQDQVLEALSAFDLGYTPNPQNAQVGPVTTGATAGRLNRSFKVTPVSGGLEEPVVVIQRLNNVFDVNAINHNLQALQVAQQNAAQQGLLLEGWRQVHFYNVRGQPDLVHFDDSGAPWRVMEFMDGVEFFDSFGAIPEVNRLHAAESLGASMATFRRMLEAAPQGTVWQDALPKYHNTGYHLSYLDAVLTGQPTVKSLSQKANDLVTLVPGILAGPYKDRIDAFLGKVDARRSLATILDPLGPSVAHNDTKINNAVFARVDGKLQVVGWVDLDTVQQGRVLDDLGDGLRSASAPLGEEPPRDQFDQIYIDTKIVRAIVNGYLSQIQKLYGTDEVNRLRPYVFESARVFFYELGIRFFTDFLVGTRYFGIKPSDPFDKYLHAAEVQFKNMEKWEEAFPSIGAGLEEMAQTLQRQFSVFPMLQASRLSAATLVDLTVDENEQPNPAEALLAPYLPAGTVAILRSKEDLERAQRVAGRNTQARVVFLGDRSFSAALQEAIGRVPPGTLDAQLLSGRDAAELQAALASLGGISLRVQVMASQALATMLDALGVDEGTRVAFMALFQRTQDNWAGLVRYL